jgi:GNAT superfamily N-acetyltransferase
VGRAPIFAGEEGAAWLAASTLPALRGRGVQGALIAARLAAARDAGCDLAFAGTAPGSASQRNFERCGFAPVYSQALLVKRFEG